jgi:hypothetical protein
MMLCPEYRNFRKYAKNYNYYFYRRNLDTRLSLPICLVIGLARLTYFMLSEWRASLKAQTSCNEDLLVLVGSENNRNAYGLIRKHLPPHDIATFHTYSGEGRRINLLRAYRTGLASLKLVPVLVLRRARYARLVCKNLDVFALTNGTLSENVRRLVSGYSGIVSFSEYSAYTNLILANRNPDARLIFFPHARLPRKHHRFLACDVFIDATTSVGFESEGVRLHPVEGLYEAISRGDAVSVVNSGNANRGKRILLCTNTLDSPWVIARLVRKIRRRLAGEGKVLVRMHPAEKFRSAKAAIYAWVAGAEIDRSHTFAEALCGTRFVYGGFTGALIEAIHGGARVYSSVPSSRLVEYFNVGELASVGDELALLDDIEQLPALAVEESDVGRRSKEFSSSTDSALRRIFAGIFESGEG